MWFGLIYVELARYPGLSECLGLYDTYPHVEREGSLGAWPHFLVVEDYVLGNPSAFLHEKTSLRTALAPCLEEKGPDESHTLRSNTAN